MILFLLVLTFSQPSIVYSSEPPTTRMLVQSPAEAAATLWLKNAPLGIWEGSYTGTLYQLDLQKMQITRVAIPQLIFQPSEAAR